MHTSLLLSNWKYLYYNTHVQGYFNFLNSIDVFMLHPHLVQAFDTSIIHEHCYFFVRHKSQMHVHLNWVTPMHPQSRLRTHSEVPLRTHLGVPPDSAQLAAAMAGAQASPLACPILRLRQPPSRSRCGPLSWPRTALIAVLSATPLSRSPLSWALRSAEMIRSSAVSLAASLLHNTAAAVPDHAVSCTPGSQAAEGWLH